MLPAGSNTLHWILDNNFSLLYLSLSLSLCLSPIVACMHESLKQI